MSCDTEAFSNWRTTVPFYPLREAPAEASSWALGQQTTVPNSTTERERLNQSPYCPLWEAPAEASPGLQDSGPLYLTPLRKDRDWIKAPVWFSRTPLGENEHLRLLSKPERDTTCVPIPHPSSSSSTSYISQPSIFNIQYSYVYFGATSSTMYSQQYSSMQDAKKPRRAYIIDSDSDWVLKCACLVLVLTIIHHLPIWKYQESL